MGLRLIATVAIGIFVNSDAQAQTDEGCLPALKPTLLDLSKRTQTSLVLYDRLVSNKKSNDKTDVGASYGPYRLDYAQAKRASSSLERLLQVDYKKDETDNIYLSTLDEPAVRAYIKCKELSKADISIAFAGDIVGSKSFFVKINWHPTFRPEGESQDGTAQITQGTFGKTKTGEMPFKIRPTDSINVMIERDPFERSEVAIEIAGRSLLFSLPPASRFRIVPQIVDGTEIVEHTGREGIGQQGKEICVKLANDDNNAALIPGSATVGYTRRLAYRSTISDYITKDDERIACSFVSAEYNSPFKSVLEIKANVRASAFKAIPIDGRPK